MLNVESEAEWFGKLGFNFPIGKKEEKFPKKLLNSKNFGNSVQMCHQLSKNSETNSPLRKTGTDRPNSNETQLEPSTNF